MNAAVPAAAAAVRAASAASAAVVAVVAVVVVVVVVVVVEDAVYGRRPRAGDVRRRRLPIASLSVCIMYDVLPSFTGFSNSQRRPSKKKKNSFRSRFSSRGYCILNHHSILVP